MWAAIAGGAEFYFSEDDYVPTKEEDSWGSPPGLLVDTKQGNVNELEARGSVQVGVKRKASDIGYAQVSSVRTKRPRRSAANQAKSYAESDLSSEERIELDSETEAIKSITTAVKETKKATESNLQLWIKHLKILQKKEQAKVRFFLSWAIFYYPNVCCDAVQRKAKANGKDAGRCEQASYPEGKSSGVCLS